MLRSVVFRSPLIRLIPVVLACLLAAAPAGADNISLLTDLEFEVIDVESTDKRDQSTLNIHRTRFSQLYSLVLQKRGYQPCD